MTLTREINRPVSVRLEPKEKLRLRYVAERNSRKPSSVIRLALEQILTLAEANKGRLPFIEELHFASMQTPRRQRQ